MLLNKWKFAKVLLLLPMLFFSFSAFAQKSVSGTVTAASDGQPLPGVNVLVQGTTQGTITDFDGKYQLSVSEGQTLVFTFVGFTNQNVVVGSQNVYDVILEEETSDLDEVVVMGYGVQKKKLVTGATVQVKGDEIAKLNTTNALGAMASSTPGVQITQSSAQPGQGFKVYIRGIGTIGDASPLYVIDGVSGGSIDNINPNDIESIDVLKDAASAANGVILVTTKQGKAGKIELTYNGSVGWANSYKRPQLLDAQQYMAIMDEYTLNTSGTTLNWSAYVPQDILDKVDDGWKGTDWWDVFMNKNAVQQNHSVTMTGGSDRSKFALSYTYTDNNGIMGGDQASYYKRHTIRMNSDHVLLKAKDFDVITIGENLSLSYNRNHTMAEGGMYWSYVHTLLQVTPLMPQFAENGDVYNYKDYGSGWNTALFSNQYENIIHGGFNSMNESHNLNVSATAHITIQPIKGLKWRTQYNVGWNSSAYRGYDEPRSPAFGSSIVESYSANQSQSLNSSFSIENTLSYDLPVLAGNKFSILAGQSFQGSKWGYNLAASNSIPNGKQLGTLNGWDSAWMSNFRVLYTVTDEETGETVTTSSASITGSPSDESYLASWFGRVNWDLNETYMATLTVRTDGSSVFNKGNRWGTFPSVSAGWVISNESFMENTQGVLDFLKIRASWGQNGNCSIPAYQYLATIKYSGSANDNGYKFGSDMTTSTAGTPNAGAYTTIVPNPDLTWETSEQLDLGFDARFLDNRLSVNFDWYKKTTKDWLIKAPQVAIQGTNPAYINGGDVENRGAELAISWNDAIGTDFKYSARVNLATNKNEVTRIANQNGYLDGAGGILSQGTEFIYRAEIGKPIGYFYGMSYSGVWQTQAQIEAAKADPNIAVLDNAQPGDLIWDDWNHDGKITYAEGAESDRHEIGNPNPDVTLGINLGLSWKGVDFSVDGAGAFGHQIMRSYRSYGDAPYQNYDTKILERWHGEGTSNSQPRLSATGHQNTVWNSTRYMEDADYFKIKSVTLGYDLKSAFKNMPLQQLRFYIQASNLYTFTGYTGLDPEVGSSGGADSWASGIDLGLYPTARTWTVGASIKF